MKQAGSKRRPCEQQECRMINVISSLTVLNSPLFFLTSFGFLSVERALISVPQLQIICYGVVGEKNGFGAGC